MTGDVERPVPTEDDLIKLRDRLKDLAALGHKITQEATAIRNALMFSGMPDKYEGVRKKSDRRLNDKGIRDVNAAFSEGMTVTQVAKKFDLSPSAASNRRKIWLAEKNS